MMLIKITAEDPEELFKAPEFPVLPAGKHLFLVANQMEITQTNTDPPKDQIRLEARCQDDDESKGMVVFDGFLLYKDAITDKEITSKKINDAALAQFVCACGVLTVDQMKAGEEFDIEDLNGKFFNAESVVRLENVYPEELDENGKPKKAPKASIKKYLVPAEEAAEATT